MIKKDLKNKAGVKKNFKKKEAKHLFRNFFFNFLK